MQQKSAIYTVQAEVSCYVFVASCWHITKDYAFGKVTKLRIFCRETPSQSYSRDNMQVHFQNHFPNYASFFPLADLSAHCNTGGTNCIQLGPDFVFLCVTGKCNARHEWRSFCFLLSSCFGFVHLVEISARPNSKIFVREVKAYMYLAKLRCWESLDGWMGLAVTIHVSYFHQNAHESFEPVSTVFSFMKI